MARTQHSFADRLAALWQDLSLGDFQLGRDGTATLEIEGRIVRFAPSIDGSSIVVSASIGTLSRDQRRRVEETQRLLRRSLGLLPLSRTGLLVGSDRNTVSVRAQIGLDRADPAALGACVEDLVARVMDYASDLSPPERRNAPARAQEAATTALEPETLIFRP